MIRLFEIFSVLIFALLFCGFTNCEESKDSQCPRDPDVSNVDKKDYDDLINYFVKVVASGNSASRYQLSSCYFDGFITRNDVEFCKCLQNTMERERIKSMTNLANLYYEIEDYKESVKWFEKAAKLGDCYAQHKLGLQYYEGKGVEQNKESAMFWFTLAAEQDEYSMITLGVAVKCLYERKIDKAERYGLRVANTGLAEAQLFCAILYSGVLPETPRNDSDFVLWCRKAAEQGYAPAQHTLGLAYYNGKYGIAQNYEEAAKWFHKATEQGNVSNQQSAWGVLYAEAQGALGVLYAEGKGVKQDMKEAYKWIRQSAEQGNPQSQSNLGQFYLGEGSVNAVEKDLEEAAKWFKKAASQGDEVGQCRLGILLLKGEGGLAKNHDEGMKLIQKAAERGNKEAQFVLGKLYWSGEGVERNFKESYKWFRKSAEQGYPKAQSYLGQFYLFEGFGFIVQRDPKEATQWFEKAAIQDDAMGQRYLAVLFMNGESGLAQNIEEAVKLLQKSAEKGDDISQFILGLMYAGIMDNVDTTVKNLLEAQTKQIDQTIGKNWIGTASHETVSKKEFNYWLDLTTNKVPVVKKDINKAKELLTKSAEQNNSQAQFYLGRIFYLEGNRQLAIKWLQKSADQGNEHGIMLLDLMQKTTESDKNKTKNEPPPPLPLATDFSPDDIFPKSASPSPPPNPAYNEVFPKN